MRVKKYIYFLLIVFLFLLTGCNSITKTITAKYKTTEKGNLEFVLEGDITDVNQINKNEISWNSYNLSDTFGKTHYYGTTKDNKAYLDNGKDQSNDMNKTMQAKINIVDPRAFNPYSNKTNSRCGFSKSRQSDCCNNC